MFAILLTSPAIVNTGLVLLCIPHR